METTDWVHDVEKIFTDHSNNIALIQESNKMSYHELGELVKIARRNLRAEIPSEHLGERPIIAIVAHRSFDLIVSMLAVWLEGYISLALNPALSDERLISEINNAQPFAVLCDDRIQNRVAPLAPQFETVKQKHIFSIQPLQQSNNMPITSQPINKSQTPSLYIAYSSGSTGKPKALLNTKKALQLAVDASINVLHLEPNINVLLRSSTDFDGFYLEVMMTLMSGATLIMPGLDYLNFSDYQRICCDHNIHVAILTPTLALPLQPEKTQLKTLVLVGEKPSTSEIQRLLRAKKDLRVINGYGLVQDGVCTTMHQCSLADDFSRGASIGAKAIPGKKLFIIDEQGQTIQTGPGQLCIQSEGLAEGYYVRGCIQPHPASQKKQAQENWSEAGFTHYDGQYIYKTGENVVLENSLYYVQGRLDNQFQMAGKTILPEPIEDKIKCLLTKKYAVGSPIVYVGPYTSQGKTRMQACVFVRSDVNLEELTFRNICTELDDLYPSRAFLKTTDDFSVLLTAVEKLNRIFITNILMNKNRAANNIQLLPYSNNMKTSDNKIILTITRKVNSLSGIDEDITLPINEELKYLGVNSDDVVRLIKSLEDHYHTPLPLWCLPEKLTIESLATHIANNLVYQKTLEVDAKNPTQDITANAYFIHPVTGITIDYKKSELIEHLQASRIRVVYCCAPLMIEDKITLQDTGALTLSRPTTLNEQADYLAYAISEHADSNPIYLIGWSFGGTLASEVAERLTKRKHRVKMTAIVDSIAPQRPGAPKKDAVSKFWAVSLAVAKEQLPHYEPLMQYLRPPHPNNNTESIEQQINTIADTIIDITCKYQGNFNRQYFEGKINTVRFCVLAWLGYSRSDAFKLKHVHLFTCHNDGAVDSPFKSDVKQWQSFCPELQHVHLENTTHFNVIQNSRFIDKFGRAIKERNKKIKPTNTFDNILSTIQQFLAKEEKLDSRRKRIEGLRLQLSSINVRMIVEDLEHLNCQKEYSTKNKNITTLIDTINLLEERINNLNSRVNIIALPGEDIVHVKKPQSITQIEHDAWPDPKDPNKTFIINSTKSKSTGDKSKQKYLDAHPESKGWVNTITIIREKVPVVNNNFHHKIQSQRTQVLPAPGQTTIPIMKNLNLPCTLQTECIPAHVVLTNVVANNTGGFKATLVYSHADGLNLRIVFKVPERYLPENIQLIQNWENSLSVSQSKLDCEKQCLTEIKERLDHFNDKLDELCSLSDFCSQQYQLTLSEIRAIQQSLIENKPRFLRVLTQIKKLEHAELIPICIEFIEKMECFKELVKSTNPEEIKLPTLRSKGQKKKSDATFSPKLFNTKTQKAKEKGRDVNQDDGPETPSP